VGLTRIETQVRGMEAVMSVSSVATPTVVVPTQLFAPSVPSTQAISMALTTAPVAAKEVTNAAVAMSPAAGNSLHGPVHAVSASAATSDATTPRAALMAGTVPPPADAGSDPNLDRQVDLYL
jgi:hypothetical protein